MPEERVHHEHDVGYKYIFSHKETFLELLRSFVKKDWVNLIKSEDLMLIDKSYILEDFSEEESDIVYKVNICGQDVIFYILLEFQSRVDYRMPMRLLFYIVELWRERLKNTAKKDIRNKNFKLPSVVPMVLYNGKNKWTASRNFKDILNSNELFGENVIDFRYILFDVYRYDEGQLEKMANMVSTVFLLDKEISREDLMKRLRLTAYVLKKITPEQFDILKMWLKGIMKPRLDTESRTKVEEILEKSSQGEVDIMVSNLGKSIDNIIREGRKEGIKAGRKEGRKEGKAELIIKMLAKKFIKLPDGYVNRIANLSDETLDKIAVDILDMEKVEELERYFKD
ncbi:Rpn family recombination-promoting nuclease/putative transposase [Clostridium tyrobutyricum]|uniref:Rpn family recombination-promoting nuclease/putative transposase n=1 Tax=Clostridium tyrobutyricum TaxID=1519 RepID=UPI0011C7767D|nr:Rpn family recombination-promoting nuclease/putative transposase [Clostridium tyrobutyricum]